MPPVIILVVQTWAPSSIFPTSSPAIAAFTNCCVTDGSSDDDNMVDRPFNEFLELGGAEMLLVSNPYEIARY